MKKTILGMGIAAFILSGAAVYRGGLELLAQGLLQGGGMLLWFFPLLIVAFVVAGLITELIPREVIYRWLGKEAGWKGPLFGALAGALVPGGPFFFYPLLATLVVSGAEIGTLISFVAAKTIWSVGRIPLEISLVGAELTVIRLVITFAFPIFSGLLVNAFLSKYTERIRADVEKLQMKKEGCDNGA